MAYYGEDEWDRQRRPGAGRHQYSDQNYLDPAAQYRREQYGGGLARSRSTGGRPPSTVNIYNDIVQETNQRAGPAPPGAFPGLYPPSPETRGRDRMMDRFGDELLAEDLNDLRLERRMRSRSRGEYYHDRSHSRGHDRSRSRVRSDASSGGRSDFYRYEMDRLEREKRDLEQRDQWKREKSRIEAELEVKRLRDEAKHKHDDSSRELERKRIIADYERKQREDAERAKEEERRIKERVEREEREAKEKEKRIREKIEREKREAKEKEEREYKEFERKQKEKKEKEEKEKKEEQHKIDEAMRERLIHAGLSGREIEAIMDQEKDKRRTTTTTTTTTLRSNALQPYGAHQPVYPKIHVQYLDIETLRYYEIPYEYDTADPNFLIVLREMTKQETNVLFDHTRAYREGRLLLDAPKKDKPDYAFYRKRERSKSRNRKDDGEWKKFGILEYKR